MEERTMTIRRCKEKVENQRKTDEQLKEQSLTHDHSQVAESVIESITVQRSRAVFYAERVEKRERWKGSQVSKETSNE